MALSLAQKKVNGLMKSNKSKNGVIAKYKSAYANYSPSITNTLIGSAGGFVAGCVVSGKYIPPTLAGVSTPLVVGGLLSAYGIFAGSNPNTGDDLIGKVAVNLGNGMLAFWSGQYALEMAIKQDIQQQAQG
jgi:hypothetical protein